MVGELELETIKTEKKMETIKKRSNINKGINQKKKKFKGNLMILIAMIHLLKSNNSKEKKERYQRRMDLYLLGLKLNLSQGIKKNGTINSMEEKLINSALKIHDIE